MDDTGTMAASGLAEGQLWKTEDAYLQIVELGKRLIHYKLLKDPKQPVALTRMIRTESLAVYLRITGATLMG
jgi:hypothetical protein